MRRNKFASIAGVLIAVNTIVLMAGCPLDVPKKPYTREDMPLKFQNDVTDKDALYIEIRNIRSTKKHSDNSNSLEYSFDDIVDVEATKIKKEETRTIMLKNVVVTGTYSDGTCIYEQNFTMIIKETPSGAAVCSKQYTITKQGFSEGVFHIKKDSGNITVSFSND